MVLLRGNIPGVVLCDLIVFTEPTPSCLSLRDALARERAIRTDTYASLPDALAAVGVLLGVSGYDLLAQLQQNQWINERDYKALLWALTATRQAETGLQKRLTAYSRALRPERGKKRR